MKTDFTSEKFEEIESAVLEMNRADGLRAAEILKQAEEYLAKTNLDGYADEHIRLLLGMSHFYVNSKEAEKAHELMQRAAAIADSQGTEADRQFVRSNIAIVYSLRGEHLRAIYIWEEILKDLSADHKLWIPIVNNLIVAYGFSNHFTKAVDMSYQLISRLEKLPENQDLMISAYINLSNSYRPLKSYDKALEANHKALELAQQRNNINYQNYICTNMAGVYSEMEDYPKALEYAIKSYEFSKHCFGDIAESEALCLLGHVELRMGRLDEAEEHLQRALEKQRKIANQVGFCDTLLSLGDLYLERGKPEEAIKYYQEIEPLLCEMDVQVHQENYHRSMNRYYQSQNDYQNAHEHLGKLMELFTQQYDVLSENMISTQEAEYLRHQIQNQNEELQASLDMLNRLLSLLSHDVRGPAASSVVALNQILESQMDMQKSHALIGHVVNNLEAVTDLLTEAMLWIESRAFSKDPAGLMHDVEIHLLVESVLRYYQGQIGQKSIRIHKSMQELSSHTEPNMLKIVLRNIISNAIKYTPPAGEIHIRLFMQEGKPCLEIRDTGVGMHQEELSKLMSKELQPKKGTAQELGMGMGLRMSLGYLLHLGIEYEVQSQIDVGTSFALKLQKAKDA